MNSLIKIAILLLTTLILNAGDTMKKDITKSLIMTVSVTHVVADVKGHRNNIYLESKNDSITFNSFTDKADIFKDTDEVRIMLNRALTELVSRLPSNHILYRGTITIVYGNNPYVFRTRMGDIPDKQWNSVVQEAFLNKEYKDNK